jgi:hypothetical protein
VIGWGRVDTFLNSEQNLLAESLLRAYRDRDSEEISYIVKSSKIIPHLDHMVCIASVNLIRSLQCSLYRLSSWNKLVIIQVFLVDRVGTGKYL